MQHYRCVEDGQKGSVLVLFLTTRFELECCVQHALGGCGFLMH